MATLPGYLLVEHLGLDLEGSSLDAGGWPLARAEIEACFVNGFAGAVTEGEREDFCWVLATALATDHTHAVWATLEGQAQQPWVYELAESREVWREALERFGGQRGYVEAAHAADIEIATVPVRQWRAEMALHEGAVPVALAAFHLGEVLRESADWFGAEVDARVLERVRARADAHGEAVVVRAIVDHLLGASVEVAARIAGGEVANTDAQVTRRALQQVRDALWPGVVPSPAITLTEGDIAGYRAARHGRARVAAGLPW
ncbi:MAG: hypothetical protein IT370_34375 [Deltaproteobacteria bacterium]|nr:hypothetical protein [Deltaproteobacteria bacterium]